MSVLDNEHLEKTLHAADMVCITDADRETMVSDPCATSMKIRDLLNICNSQIRVNDFCRQMQKPFYAGGSYGLVGYIFCDLITHEFLTP